MGLRWRFSAYATMLGAGIREAVAYRGNFLFSLVGVLVQVLLLSMVWTAAYAGRNQVDGVDLATMVTYVTLISVQQWVLTQSTVSQLPERVRTGQVAFDICRPLGLVGQVFPRQAGRTVAVLPFAGLALPIAGLIGELRPPGHLVAGLMYPVSLILAYMIAILANTVIGLLAFWTFETRGIQFMYITASTFFAGALVPLWFMPDWLRRLCEVLPFQAAGYTPVAAYLGRFEGSELVGAITVQLLWVLGFALLVHAMWRRGVHRVVIQGG